MKKVSILIPVYNSALTLEQTIQSAINQTWKNKEIVIVDDGSTDHSFILAKKYECDWIKVFYQKNQGACAARNACFKFSSGDYIQYLDADDVLNQNKIEQQMQVLSNETNKVISSSSWGTFYDNIEAAVFREDELWKDMLPIDWLITSVQRGLMMQTACWLTHRDIIQKAGPWNTELRENPADDGEFFTRVLINCEKVVFNRESIVYYRKGSNYVSNNWSRNAIESRYKNCEHYEFAIRSLEDSSKTRRASLIMYASFIYTIYPHHPDLLKAAKNKMVQLGYNRYNVPVGDKFRKITSFLGFENTLRIRRIINVFKKENIFNTKS